MKAPWIFFILSLAHAWAAAILTFLEMKPLSEFAEGMAVSLALLSLFSLITMSASQPCDCQNEEQEDGE